MADPIGPLKGDTMKPRARSENLVTEETEEGLVIYDLERHHAHTLHLTASVIYKACDGTRDVRDLAFQLSAELDIPADEQLVDHALQELAAAHLLADALTHPGRSRRRAVLRRVPHIVALGLLSVPIITSLPVPPPLAAASAGCQPTPVTNGDICDCGNGCMDNGSTGGQIEVYSDSDCTSFVFARGFSGPICDVAGSMDTCGNSAVGAGFFWKCV